MTEQLIVHGRTNFVEGVKLKLRPSFGLRNGVVFSQAKLNHEVVHDAPGEKMLGLLPRYARINDGDSPSSASVA